MSPTSEKSLPLVTAWQEIQTRLAEQRPAIHQGTSRKFIDYAWKNFDPHEVINILAQPGDSYFAHKDILYEGLCAWIADPKNPTLPQHGMVLRTAIHLDAAEKFGRDRFGGVGQIGDIYIRTNIVGAEFFEEIYYPIGGILRISRSLSRAGYRAKLTKRSKGLRHAIRVLAIYHHHVDHLSVQKIFRKPSLNIAAGLVSEIDPLGDKLPGERAIKDYWSAYKKSVALGYAADTIEVEQGKSLLDLILASKSTWRKHCDFVPLWFGRTRYIAEHILSQCAETETATSTLQEIPEVLPIKFSSPKFTEQQTNNIELRFKKRIV